MVADFEQRALIGLAFADRRGQFQIALGLGSSVGISPVGFTEFLTKKVKGKAVNEVLKAFSATAFSTAKSALGAFGSKFRTDSAAWQPQFRLVATRRPCAE